MRWVQNDFAHVAGFNQLAPIERFSIECRKTKTKVITLANHKGHI